MSIHFHTRPALAVLTLFAAGATHAGIYTVTTTADTGPGSLRQIITDLPVDEANEIRFSPGGTGVVTITVASPLPSLRGTSMLIDGRYSMGGIVIDGAATWRLFWSGTVPTTFRNITVQRGAGGSTSGCIQANADLVLEQVTVRECRVGRGSGNAYGGGITSNGNLTVRYSIFEDNHAQSDNANGDQSGAAIYHGGGTLLIEDSLFDGNVVAPGPNIFSSGGAVSAVATNATIRRSRFIGNSVTGAPNGGAAGGGIHCGLSTCTIESSYFGNNASSAGGAAIELQTGALVLRNVTVHDNIGGAAAAVRVVGTPGQPATLAIESSTFSGNAVTAPGGRSAHLDLFLDTQVLRIVNTVFGARGSNHPGCHRWDSTNGYAGPGFNLSTDASCEPLLGTDSALATPTALGLGAAVFGGHVETLYLDAGSALVDAGNPDAPGSSAEACPVTDANGVRRPRDGNGDGSERCDVGAGELRGAIRGDILLDDPPPARVTAFTLAGTPLALGADIANVGDINGDGIDDIGVIGADPFSNDGRGKAWIVYGRPGGFAAGIDLFQLESHLGFGITGAPGRVLTGIAAAGDLNGDGYGDVLLGAPSQDAISAGAGYIVHGGTAPSPLQLDVPDSTRFARIGHTGGVRPQLGACVAGVDDFDGDGHDDVMIGAHHAGAVGATEAFIGYGPVSSVADTLDLGDGSGWQGVLRLAAAPPDLIGSICRAAGDVDGDGRADVLIGSPWRETAPGADPIGAAWLVYGRGPGDIALAALGANAAREFVGTGLLPGAVLAGRHDFDGDARPDPIIGTLLGADPAGLRNQAWIVGGGPGGTSPVTLGPTMPGLVSTLDGDAAIHMLHELTGVDDVDGDGRADLIASAPGAGTDDGEVMVNLTAQRGPTDWPPPAFDPEQAAQGAGGFRIIGRAGQQGRLGSRVAGGDFDGDGLGDLLLTAPGERRVWLVRGHALADMAVDASQVELVGAQPAQTIAGSVACRNLGTRNAMRASCTVQADVPLDIACTPTAPATLAPGEAIVCTVGADVPAPGLELDARAYSATQDPDGANNRVVQRLGGSVGPDTFPNGFRDGFED